MCLQARAAAYCEEVRCSAECWRLCLQRFSASSFVEVRFWCLQTLHEVRPLGPTLLHTAVVPHVSTQVLFAGLLFSGSTALHIADWGPESLRCAAQLLRARYSTLELEQRQLVRARLFVYAASHAILESCIDALPFSYVCS